MNVYDFDGTLYKGDSSKDFILFLIRKKPSLIFKMPNIMLKFFAYSNDKKRAKEIAFSILKYVNAELYLEEFWNKYFSKKIVTWYKSMAKSYDMIISASPEFLLEPACRRLNIKSLIGTRMAVKSGAIYGENCKGEEKVRRLQERKIYEIDQFYSDSFDDQPLANIAKQAFLVMPDGTFLNWPKAIGKK